MKVFIGGIETETNTFSPMPTGIRDFVITRDADIGKDGIIGGLAAPIDLFRRMSKERGWESVFSLYANAEPAGITTRATYEELRDEILTSLKKSVPVDIVFLQLHGAMVADGYDDCETDIISEVRAVVGKASKIGVELDLHCDLTQDMIDLSDAIVIYKEYPHTDIVDRAEDLFNIIADASEGKISPTMSVFDCRMIGLYRTSVEPMRSFVDDFQAMEGKNGILSISLAHCFPWSDVPTCGVKTLVITDGDLNKATTIASEIGRKFFDLRYQLDQPELSLDDALDQALAIEKSPVVIADRSDNAGGGAPSDSTFVLKALLERGIDNVGVAMIWDPVVVQVAMSAGKGAALNVRLGGKMGPMSGEPLDLKVMVSEVVENMVQEFPQRSEPIRILCGNSVSLQCQGINIVANSIRTQVFSPQVFSQLGIDPLEKRLLVVKSTQHFYAGFSSIASEIVYMAAPGAVAPRFKEIPYKRVNLNKYPWVDNPFLTDQA